MTTIDDAARLAGPATTLPRAATADRGRRRFPALVVGVALTAALGGGVLGVTAARAIPELGRDPVAEHARLETFAARLHRAFLVDDLWQQQHPIRP